MFDIKVGDRVQVVEHHEPTRTRLPGGDTHPATVTSVAGLYVNVRYNDPAINGGQEDPFYRESGWRAWDGRMRWRLEPCDPG